MNAIRTSFALRIATVTVAFFSWLVISNHCVLTEIFAKKSMQNAVKEHNCCNPQSVPNKDEQPCPAMPQGCCKSLTVVVPVGAKLASTPLLEVPALPVEWLVVFTLARQEQSNVGRTGQPPDVPAFVELVLHRSLHSHAPPFAA